jgi:hypothetical protein
VQRRVALAEFCVAKAEGEAAGLPLRNIGAGCFAQAMGEIQPEFGGTAGPVHIRGHSSALALDPNQAKITTGRANAVSPWSITATLALALAGTQAMTPPTNATADYDDIEPGRHTGMLLFCAS